jgi:NAD+ diphosphatase
LQGLSLLHTGSLNGISVFAALSEETGILVPGTVPVSTQSLRENPDRGAAFAALNAIQLSGWVQNNRFCGKCGSPMEFAQDERALSCSHCHNRVYPRINPAIITAIIDRKSNKMLCARGIHYRGGFYSLIAGYVEVGESFEQAVAREVMEEVGLKVKNITYYANQPWPFSSSQMVGFFCEVDGDTTLHLNPAEIGDAIWVSPEEIPRHPYPVSIASVMMESFRDGSFTLDKIVPNPFTY